MAAVIGAGTLALPIGQYQVRADSNTPAATDAKIDLNTATDKDLETMPGVGTSTA
jgi:DNA uptake protein ComE-like DNA-binding protein